MSFIGNVKAILNNLVRDIRATVTDELGVEIGGNNIDVFGDLVGHEYTPIWQASFTSGVYTQIGTNTVANSAPAADISSSRLRLQSGTNSAGSNIYVSHKILQYRAGQAMLARWTTVFGTGVASNTQIIGPGNADNGYFFGYNGTSFGILFRQGGSDAGGGGSGPGWTPQASWNVDVCDGSGPSGFNLNPLLGNVYQIRYPYLGYGAIKFHVLNPATALWVLVHVIKYPNTSATIQITNPGLQFYARNLNAGSTTNTTMLIGSAGAFLSGQRQFLGPQFGVDSTPKSVTLAAGEVPLISIANTASINGVTNRGMLRVRQIVATAEATGQTVRIRWRKNQTLTSPTWLAYNGTIGTAPTASSAAASALTSAQSLVFADIAAASFSGTPGAPGSPGTSNVEWNAGIGPQSGTPIDLTPYDIYLMPGEFGTFSALVTGTTSVTAMVNGNEEL